MPLIHGFAQGLGCLPALVCQRHGFRMHRYVAATLDIDEAPDDLA
jgi:hypothetical protein